jgi:uncharacterized phage-associated protein
MLVDHSKEKLLNSIIFFANNVKNLTKTQLMKYLFYLDSTHFKQTGKNVTGSTYKAYQYGPMSEDINNNISDTNSELLKYIAITEKQKSGFKSYVVTTKKKFDDKYFSRRELKILKNLIYIFKGMNASQMSNASHEHNKPWSQTLKKQGEKAIIDYMLTIEDDDFREFVQTNINERNSFDKVLDNEFKR